MADRQLIEDLHRYRRKMIWPDVLAFVLAITVTGIALRYGAGWNVALGGFVVGVTFSGLDQRMKARRLHTADDRAVLDAVADVGGRHVLDISRVTRLSSARTLLALDRLEDRGLVVGEFETGVFPRRRVYELTRFARLALLSDARHG